MIRAVAGWFRLVYPPWWAVALWAFVYAVNEGLCSFVIGCGGTPDEVAQFDRFRLVTLGIGLWGYAAFRVAAFHPVNRPDYRTWLERTPWTAGKPLPLGPVHVVAQDLLVLAVAAVAARDWAIAAVLVPAAFLGPYLASLALSFFATGPWWMGYVLAFGLGLAARLASFAPAAVGVLIVLNFAGWFGLRMALRRFPWEVPKFWSRPLGQTRVFTPTQAMMLVLPCQPLRASGAQRWVRRRDAILVPLLAGWWLYAVFVHLSDPSKRLAIMSTFYGLTAIAAVATRIVAYVAEYRPPLSILGRIRTGRLVIPGYDKALVAPFLVAAAAVAVPISLYRIGVSEEIIFPAALSLVLLVATNVGPTLWNWRLTGHHRIAPLLAGNREIVRL